jgi:hypothetical protein
MPHVLLHHLCVTRHILMTAKFGTQFQFQFQFHFETQISIVFPPVSPCSSTPVLRRPQRLATFPGPDHSQNAKFVALCLHGLLCRSLEESECADHRHLLQRNLAPRFAAHKLQNMTYLLIRVAEVPAKNMP